MSGSQSPEVTEGMVRVPGGEVWYQRVGQGDGVPLVTVHGGPGIPSSILREGFDRLAAGREVIYYDQLGVGRSSRADDPSLWTIDRSVDELQAVIEGLGLERPHVYGHSWGAMIGLEAAARGDVAWSSLVAGNGLASTPRAVESVQRLMRNESGRNWYERIVQRELDGTSGDPDYQAALAEFSAKYGIRNDEPGPAMMAAMGGANWPMVSSMIGYGDWHVTGSLAEWDIMGTLNGIRVPTLVICGEFDEIDPAHQREIAALIPGAEFREIPDASHVVYLEHEAARAGYLGAIEHFMERVEDRRSDILDPTGEGR